MRDRHFFFISGWRELKKTQLAPKTNPLVLTVFNHEESFLQEVGSFRLPKVCLSEIS